MLRVVLIEDERIIAEELKSILASVSPDTEVMATLGSVNESVQYFSEDHQTDLIFSDIQLPDGLSFDIFSKQQGHAPVVFLTGFDNFIVNAFEHNGIDYLLKPVSPEDIAKVIQKYKRFEKHFGNRQKFFDSFGKKKERMIVRKGLANIILKLEDIVLFYSESKVVFVIDKEGKKYVSEYNLGELEEMLDHHTFFRANRQYIINSAYIKAYKSHEKVKLSVDMELTDLYHQIIISQETARHFRRWISQL